MKPDASEYSAHLSAAMAEALAKSAAAYSLVAAAVELLAEVDRLIPEIMPDPPVTEDPLMALAMMPALLGYLRWDLDQFRADIREIDAETDIHGTAEEAMRALKRQLEG